MYTLAEGFDNSFMFIRDLEAIYKMVTLLHIFTDSKSMFDVMIKSSSTTEKRIMINSRAIQEAYKREEISNAFYSFLRHTMSPMALQNVSLRTPSVY